MSCFYLVYERLLCGAHTVCTVYTRENQSRFVCSLATRYYTTALIDIGSGVVDEDYRGPVKITTYYHYLY